MRNIVWRSLYAESKKKWLQMSLLTKQKQTHRFHRFREGACRVYDCQGQGGGRIEERDS